MKKLIEKVFKKKSEFDTTLAAYHLTEVDVTKLEIANTPLDDYDSYNSDEADDMQIDRIYQSL